MNTQTTTANEVAQAPVKVKGARKPAKSVPAAPQVPVIKLTGKEPDYKATSARAIWFLAVSKFNGKAVDECVEALTKKPRMLTKGGKAEHPGLESRARFILESMESRPQPHQAAKCPR